MVIKLNKKIFMNVTRISVDSINNRHIVTLFLDNIPHTFSFVKEPSILVF